MKKIVVVILVHFFYAGFGQLPFNRIRENINKNEDSGLLKTLDSCMAKGYHRDSTLYYMGLVNLKAKHITEAQNNYKMLRDEFPDFKESHYLHGMIYYINESYGKSIDEFSLVIKNNPKHIKALYNRSVALGQIDDFLSAIQDLDACISLNPKYTLAYYSRAYWYESVNNYVEASKDYERTLRLEPKNFDAYLGLAYAYQNMKENIKACETITKAIAAGSQIAEEVRHNFCK